MKTRRYWLAAMAALAFCCGATQAADNPRVTTDPAKTNGGVTVAPTEPVVPALSRISWAAVLAGAAAALAAHMTFSALGIGLGAACVDPHDRRKPIAGVPTMLFIWMFVSGLLALFLGGAVSGRMSGTAPYDSAMHGFITWSLATVALFALAGTSVGYVVGGVFRALGATASGAAQAVAAVAPEVAGMAKNAVAANVPQLDWTAIKREAKQLVRQAGAKQPESKAAEFGKEDLGELLQKAYGAVRDGLDPGDRQELIDAFAATANVSKEDAVRAIDKWEQSYQKAKQEYRALAARAEAEAREAAEKAKTAVSQAAIFTFLSLLLGAAVSGYAGYIGSTYVRL